MMEHTIRDILSRAPGAAERSMLLEHELLDLLQGMGLPVPRHLFLTPEQLEQGAVDLAPFSGGRVVLKVVSEHILHKSDVGGVAFVEPVPQRALLEPVQQAARVMLDGLPPGVRQSVLGLVLEQAIPFEAGLGRELLLGMRHSPEFGTVFTVGFGGTYVEALAQATLADQSTILFKPGVTSDDRLASKLDSALFFRWASGRVRGVEGISAPDLLHRQLSRWIDAMERLRQEVEACGRSVQELEFNPLVWDEQQHAWIPVDAMLRLGPALEPAPAFPIDSLARALAPRRVAIMGASAKGMNVGRIILRCMLEGGPDWGERVVAIHPEADAIDGVACRRSLDELEQPVELLVLAVAASSVVEILEQALTSGKVTGGVLLIPGGMGETEEGKAIEQQVLELLARQPAARPVLIGNNSLGFVSRRSAFDSLFIPRTKLPRVEDGLSNVALISQSGAFMITALTKLDFLSPDYQISLGNQIDARVSHFLEALAETEGITTYALYIEGLKPTDGQRLATLVQRVVAAGRDVVVYKAGRNALGQKATMGHTASVAGDYRVLADLLTDAGALVAETFTDFLDLVRLSATLQGRRFTGRRVAMMSNAGYEVVGLADNHRGPGHQLEPAELGAKTVRRLDRVLCEARLSTLVTVKNPLDLTPMASDAVHIACMEAILADPAVDMAVFGNVPLTSMVQSLPHGVSDSDVFDAPAGYANRTIELFRAVRKPFVVVIDGGRLYDPMADHLQRAGVPVFRSGDHAIRMLGRYVRGRRAQLTRRY